MEQFRNVSEAAVFLDLKVPGWFKRIDKDILDMGNVYRCIRSQLFFHEWQQSQEINGITYEYPFEYGAAMLGIDKWSEIFGNGDLTAEWIEQINYRLSYSE